MSLKFRLVSHKLGSSSLKRLAEGLSTVTGHKVFRAKHPKPNRENILYGDCKDKIAQYMWFKAQNLPALTFTTNHEEAKAWFQGTDTVVFARKLTRASEGKGIVVATEAGQLPAAPVYTLYKKKKKEFRVHVFKDVVVQVLEKRKRKEFTGERDSRIRNTANGYVFCSEGVVEPAGLRELALKASKVTSSHFRGVDIGFNEKLNELFVIEVNSAPGIEGSNVDKYVQTILKQV